MHLAYQIRDWLELGISFLALGVFGSILLCLPLLALIDFLRWALRRTY